MNCKVISAANRTTVEHSKTLYIYDLTCVLIRELFILWLVRYILNSGSLLSYTEREKEINVKFLILILSGFRIAPHERDPN